MFSNPQNIIAQVGINPPSVVLDIGAGSGAYSFAISKRVGEKGRVYALEVQKELLTRIKNDAQSLHLGNIEVLWGDIENPNGTKLRSKSVDFVILANVLFQIRDKEAMFKEISRVLKKDGKVLVVDWSGSYGGLGPSENDVVTQGSAENLFLQHSFHRVNNINAGSYHYGIIFVYESNT